jgi:hypothetical protein
MVLGVQTLLWGGSLTSYVTMWARWKLSSNGQLSFGSLALVPWQNLC